MSDYTVDRDVPLPPEHGKAGKYGKLKYPWNQMSIGDSFAVPIPEGTKYPTKMIQSVRLAGLNYIRRHGIENTTCVVYVRNETEGGVKSRYIRAWWMEKTNEG